MKIDMICRINAKNGKKNFNHEILEMHEPGTLSGTLGRAATSAFSLEFPHFSAFFRITKRTALPRRLVQTHRIGGTGVLACRSGRPARCHPARGRLEQAGGLFHPFPARGNFDLFRPISSKKSARTSQNVSAKKLIMNHLRKKQPSIVHDKVSHFASSRWDRRPRLSPSATNRIAGSEERRAGRPPLQARTPVPPQKIQVDQGGSK